MSKTTIHKTRAAADVSRTPPPNEKDFTQDIKTHEALPPKTKELELLQHHAEKATGQESIALNKIIAEKTK